MFDFGTLGLCVLILVALAGAVIVYRKVYESTPLASVHTGKARDEHDHGSFGGCKFDAEEVRRTANQKRPRIDVSGLEPDPRVASLLAEVNVSEVEHHLRELTGELPATVGGTTKKLVTRNSYHKDMELVLGYLEQFYSSLGLKFERHTYKVRGRTHHNLIVEFTGSANPGKVLYLGAHMDSTAGWPWSTEELAPGADDDGSGTVALMAIAKALTKMRPGCSVRLCHFSCEEQGLYGSYAYSDVVAARKNETVIGLIQMDMIGYCANSANRVDVHDERDRNGSHSLVEVLTKAATRYSLNLRVFDTHNYAVANRSDHAGFLDHGFKAVMVSEEFNDQGFNPMYHTRGDRVSNCNMPYMVEVIRMVLAGTVELAECK